MLTDEWLVCSPLRTQRPWQGDQSPASSAGVRGPDHDALCYLCPRNARSSGVVNDDYSSVWVFQNDFPALRPDPIIADSASSSPSSPTASSSGSLLQCQTVTGSCRVICYSPDHSLTLADMSVEAVREVVGVWQEQCRELAAQFRYVQVFENKGAVMGCSNPHPHGQVWASDFVPQHIEQRCRAFAKHATEHDGACSLCDYVQLELDLHRAAAAGNRVLFVNASWAVVVPFWAYWPFEAMVAPRSHVSQLQQLTAQQSDDLAEALSALTRAYDRLFATQFPYSMGLLQQPQPSPGASPPLFHLCFMFYPPLLRNASVKKYQVGYEMFADLCRDITAEDAAAQLRTWVDPVITK